MTAVVIFAILSILLVAGKGHETYQETREGRRPFSDVEILRRFRA